MSGVLRGTADVVSRGEQRKASLTERDEQMMNLMADGRPVDAIAQFVGLDEVHCRKRIKELQREHNVEYTPERSRGDPVGFVTPGTQKVRNHFSNLLHDLLQRHHPIQIAMMTGVKQANQKLAAERGGKVNLTMSQLERIAIAAGSDFNTELLNALTGKKAYG